MPDGNDLQRFDIEGMARSYGLDPDIIRAQIIAESSGKQSARSPKGAVGLMQLMPDTAKRLGVDPTDPEQNLHGGMSEMQRLMGKYGSYGKALAAYNAGEGAVDKGILPAETQSYVQKILGGRKGSGPTDVGEKPQNFLDIAKSFPPDLSANTYDAAREHYFRSVIVPRMQPGESYTATWEKFKSMTERQPLLTPFQRGMLMPTLGATSLVRTALEPLKGLDPTGSATLRRMSEGLEDQEAKLTRLGEREGINTIAPRLAGSLGGTVLDFEALSTALGPTASSLFSNAAGAGRVAQIAERTARGGLAFGALDALNEDQGNRFVAGAKGFAVGAGIDLALGTAGLLFKRTGVPKEIADTLTQRASMGEKLPPPIDQAIAEQTAHQAETSRLEGRSNFWSFNTGVPGARLVIKDVSGATAPIEIKPNREYDAYRQAMNVVKQGGSLDHIEVHPNDQRLANEFLRIQQGVESAKAKSTVVRTAPGQGVTVAEAANAAGLPAEVVGQDTVHVATVEARAPGGGTAEPAVAPSPKVAAPSSEEIEEVLRAKNVSEQNRTFLQNQLEKIWDPDIPPEDKAARIKAVAKVAPELLPDVYGKSSLPRSASGGLDLEGAKRNIEAEGLKSLGYTPNVPHIFPHSESPSSRVLAYVQSTDFESARTAADLLKQKLGSAYDIRPMGPSGRIGEVPVSQAEPTEWWEQAQREEKLEGLRRSRFAGDRMTWDDIEQEADFRNVPKGEVDFESLVGKPKATVEKALDATRARLSDMATGEATARSAPTAKGTDIDAGKAKGGQGSLFNRVPRNEMFPIDLREGKGIEEAIEDSVGGKFLHRMPGEVILRISRPGIPKAVMGPEEMERFVPGAQAAATPDIREALRTMGVELPDSIGQGTPGILLRDDWDKPTLWHETLHANMHAVGLMDHFPVLVPDVDKGTALAIAKGLTDEFPVYTAQGANSMINEAYTHAAQAFRFNDVEYLNFMSRLDTDLKTVARFVNGTSRSILDVMDIEGLESKAKRDLQRSATDLLRRTDRNVMGLLSHAVHETGTGIGAWFDPARGWVLKESEESERTFKNLSKLWDHLLIYDRNDSSPSYSFLPDRVGVKGGLAPQGSAPNGETPPNAELPRGKDTAWTAVSALWRPMLPWAASADEAINKILRVKGLKLDIYDKVRAVDTADMKAGQWRRDWMQKGADILQHLDQGKMKDVMEYLTHSPVERTNRVVAGLKLTQDEVLRAEQFSDLLDKFEEETNIGTREFLRSTYPRLRGAGWDPSFVWGPGINPNNPGFWEKAIRYDGTLEPRDLHAGRFYNFLVEQGVQKKFTGEALSDLNKVINTKVGDTYLVPKTLRYPLQNYHNYMKNIPDMSMSFMNDTLQGMFDRINKRIAAVNEHMPEGLQIPQMTTPPRQLLNRFTLMSYVGGMGARPAVMLRDSMQALTGGLTVLGPERFTRALHAAMTPEAGEFARKAGALLEGSNPGELYGDIFREMPPGGKGWFDKLSRWSNMLLAPSRWGHNFGRRIVFMGEYADSLDAIQDLRAGKISSHDLMYKTTLHFADAPRQGQLIKEALDVSKDPTEVAKKFGLEAVDLTQFPYRRGTQPLALRFGAGRILGQFGVWPLNFIDFSQRLGRKFVNNPQFYSSRIATWAAVNYAASSAMEAAGVDSSRWFWQSPMGFAGSPHMQFVMNLMKSPENSEQGRQARKDVLTYPLDFLPAENEIQGILTSIQGQGFDEWPPSHSTLLRALGFKPLVEHQSDRDWEQWVRFQLGFKQGNL